MFYSRIILILNCMVFLMVCQVLGENNDPKSVYYLKCHHSKTDCTLFESLPKFDVEVETEPTQQELVEEIKENGRRSEDDNVKFQNLIKRFFTKNGDAPKVYKTNEINCLTGDCRLLTAKINKRNRNGPGTLACVGDPYSNSGSRCVPIEGLYIGK